MVNEDLKELVRLLEAGNQVIQPKGSTMTCAYIADEEGTVLENLTRQRFKILVESGVIEKSGADDNVIYYKLTYDPYQTSIDGIIG